jgi:hypothetical protein
MLRNTAWDAAHLGYFLGYARWNYFTTPFVFTYPDVVASERRMDYIVEVNGSTLVGHYTRPYRNFDGRQGCQK